MTANRLKFDSAEADEGGEIRAAHVSKRLGMRTPLSRSVRSLTVAALIGEYRRHREGPVLGPSGMVKQAIRTSCAAV